MHRTAGVFEGRAVLQRHQTVAPDLPVTSNTRPSNVVGFEKLMYFALGVEVISAILQWNQVMDLVPSNREASMEAAIVAYSTNVLFIWLVARRRKNWARWAMLIGKSLGCAITLPLLGSLPFFVSVLTCVTWLAEIVAFVLIFTGNSREWFDSTPSSLMSSDPASSPN